MLKWNVTKTEHEVIDRIARRAYAMAKKNGDDWSLTDWEMDITAAHLNDCGLKLLELFAADDFNFAHDVFGIRRHIDRQTGKLQNCFVPRYAA